MGDREVDQQLVERAQRGDKRAFELLVLKYQRKLGTAAVAVGARPGGGRGRDAGSFIKAYRALPSFRGDSAFYTWLYRIGDQHREELPRRAGPPGADDDRLRQRGSRGLRGCRAVARLEHAGERAAKARRSRPTVNRAMDALPEDLRTAITLREIEGLSYEEIASVMNCPIGTVRSRIFRAREAIAAELRPLLGTEENRRW